MQKKYLIMMVMVLAPLLSWAQTKTLCASPHKSAVHNMRKAPNKNIWYAKPEGTFYRNTYPSASLVVPPLTPLTFENKCDDIDASSWSLNGETKATGTQTFQTSYPAMREEALFPAPQLSIGADTFALGRMASGNAYIDGHIVTTNAIANLSKTDYVVGGSYIGWSDMPGFSFRGSRDLNGDGTKEDFVFHSLVQHYPKPASPFYLSALTIPFSSYQTDKDMIPEGKEVTVRIDEGSYGNTVATGHITKADIDQTKWNEGDPITYAGPSVTFDEGPVILTDEFFIVIEGLEECEQMGLWTTLPAAYEQETEENRTRTEGYDEDGNYHSTTWSNTSGNEVSYWEAIIYLTGMFDVAEVDSSCLNLTASAEGETVELLFRSSRASLTGDTPSYFLEGIDGLSEWIGIQSTEDTDDHQTRITLAVEPYDGPTPEGREASLRIRSSYGACTDYVTIKQVPKVGDLCSTLSDDGRQIQFIITDTDDYTCEIADTDIPEDGTIAIPASIWGFEVAGIADDAFVSRDDLVDITFQFAYNSCGGNIGKYAFKGCKNLKTVTFDENTSSIGDNAFADCDNIEKVISQISARNLWSFNDNVFDATVYEKALLIVPDGKVEQYQATAGWSNFKNIMDAETAAGIKMPLSTTHNNAADIYMLDGRHANKAQRGINIIRTEDGTMKKVVTF